MSDDTSPRDDDRGQSMEGGAFEYAVAEDERHSDAVVRAVASFTDTPVLDIEPLYHTVDPVHLNGLFEDAADAAARVGQSVTFEFHGCTVRVTPGEIRVTERDDGD